MIANTNVLEDIKTSVASISVPLSSLLIVPVRALNPADWIWGERRERRKREKRKERERKENESRSPLFSLRRKEKASLSEGSITLTRNTSISIMNNPKSLPMKKVK